jgi:lysophospholipase L1-like esterase
MTCFKRLFAKLFLVLFGLFLALCFLEIILRLIGFSYYHLNKNRTTFKADSDENSIKILCVGESTTFGFQEDVSYPILLEDRLNELAECDSCYQTEILAWSGVSTSKLLIKFPEKLYEINPDLVIIMTGVNYNFNFTGNPLLFTKQKIDSKSLKVVLDNIYQLRLAKVIMWSLFSNNDGFMEGVDEVNYYLNSPNKGQTFLTENEKIIEKLLSEELSKFIAYARRSGAIPILMNYHLSEPYIISAYDKVSQDKEVTLIDQHRYFQNLFMSGTKQSEVVLQGDDWHPNTLGYNIMVENIINSLAEQKLIQL